MVETTMRFLTPTQRYAAGALFALSVHQAQIHQTRLLGDPAANEELPTVNSPSSCSSSDSVSGSPELWVHENSGLLRPVFRFLEIDVVAWSALEETAGSSQAKHHVGAFLRLLSEETGDSSSQRLDQELALSKAIEAMVLNMEMTSVSAQSKKEKHLEYEHDCREKFSTAEVQSNIEAAVLLSETLPKINGDASGVIDPINGPNTTVLEQSAEDGSNRAIWEQPVEEERILSYQRKVAVLYELLSACLENTHEENKKCTRKRKGYDARHCVALRLLSTWLDMKWIQMEAIETLVACSAMTLAKRGELKEEESPTKANKWAKWRRGGIIGAAALAGGALLAITGGLAAPEIAAGFDALAPTLGAIVPVMGASRFAAAATAVRTVVSSVAVAASFGAAGAGLTGTKMARRTGSVDGFELKAIGENHNQGKLAVEILVSGFVFVDEDFIRPWEGVNSNLERYALQWESKNLIAVSTATQDWPTSTLAMGLMKQGATFTVLSRLLTALTWPATLIWAADFIDSKWTIAINRSDKAGKLLAEVLLKGVQGNRPVTLVGYSLGARVIFKCLQYLAETEKNAEVVERVVLLGAPISIKDQNWETARKMVAGRFVNVYSTNDWMLGIAFRASLLSQGLAGIQPVDVPGIQNVNVTDLVEGHSSYLWVTQQIVEQLELDTYYPVFRSSVSEQ